MGTNEMHLWESVHNTPPQYTKGFKRGGGFSGTAIDPTYLVMRATELWGPIGGNWGYEIVSEEYVEGEPIVFYPKTDDAPPMVIGHIKIHKIRLRLWYPVTKRLADGTVTESVGKVEQFGQTTFIGRDKNGLFTDEEHAKKSTTDALSKCMSLLGFGADVRIGAFEDSVYAQTREENHDQVQTAKSMGQGITVEQKQELEALLKKMNRKWEALATVCASRFKREVKTMDDLTDPEAVAVLAFLHGRAGK